MYQYASDPHGKPEEDYECWWSEPNEENIILYSASDQRLPTHGVGADHAIVNAVVQGLTGILADTGTHKRGPKNCPLYWNPELDLELTINRQEFDSKCDLILKRKIPNDLPALKALLGAFD
jgi:hypothetical protein